MIRVGARSSPLSRAQFEEVRCKVPCIEPVWVETTGDLDRKTSLRNLGQSDFFTKELDEMLLRGEIQAAIHSAKDLPEPLAEGLVIVALTKCIDPRDSLVFQGERLPRNAKIATSSARREETVRELYEDACFVDVRGNIGERLHLLETGVVDGVVIAEAALIRLGLQHLNRVFLPGETAKHQGRLAVVARSGDCEMRCLFEGLNV